MAPNLEGVTTQSLANPVVQPSDAQLLEQTTIASLRSTQHLDINGNPISKYSDFLLNRMNANNFPADPDLSNPTRPRLERPLDTIRSFEKAIDAGYKRRSSMMRGGESLHSLLFLVIATKLILIRRIVRPISTTPKQAQQRIR